MMDLDNLALGRNIFHKLKAMRGDVRLGSCGKISFGRLKIDMKILGLRAGVLMNLYFLVEH